MTRTTRNSFKQVDTHDALNVIKIPTPGIEPGPYG